MHLDELIRDMGIVLAIAGIVSVLFHRIRQPVVLGYICAGILVAAFARPIGSDLRTLAELGVIFLMFTLGLEFSFRKVVRLGPTVAFTAIIEVSALAILGYWVGRWLGWSVQNSLFLGGMVSISSTTIIVKAFDEFGLKSRRFAQVVLGMLVFEDLLAILMLVGFSSMASGGRVSSLSLAGSLGTLILFVGGWFLVGVFLLPRFLKRVASTNSDEMLMVVSVGLCLAMGIAASQLGYSAGLGAFLMGSILSESSESHRIEDLVRPLKDLFVAIFFVSIGMLIDPRALGRHAPEIVLLSLVVIAGKFLFATLGSLLVGRSLQTSILVGGSMTQIGEFSFIMAALGISSGLLDPEVQPTIVAVSVVTTLVTPWAIRKSPGWVRQIEQVLPARLRLNLEHYAAWSDRRAAAHQPDPELRGASLRWALSGFVVTLISRLAMRFAGPWIGAVVGITLLPFLWVFLRGIRFKPEVQEQVRGQLLSAASRVVALAWCSMLAWPFFRGTPVIWILAILSALMIVQLVGSAGKVFHWFEKSFLDTLESGRTKSKGDRAILKKFAPWEGQLVRLKVHPDSEVSGQSIQEAALRNRFGLNIVAIHRGSRLFVAPSPRHQLFPKDEVLVLGVEDMVERARKVIELGSREVADEGLAMDSYQLRAIDVTDASACAGKTLKDSGIRDRYSALVVGIERDGKRIMNPDSSMKVHPGDTLWLVGENERLAELASELAKPHA